MRSSEDEDSLLHNGPVRDFVVAVRYKVYKGVWPGGELHVELTHKGVLQRFAFAQDGETVFLDGMSGHFVFQNMSHEPALAGDAAADGKVKAPMDGAVVDVKVGIGDSVSKGDTLLVMEAMKMEHALKAGSDGVIESISAASGDQVKSKQVLVSIAPDTEGE